jgi:diacylglycerol kinase
MEIINSSIENICDFISPEKHKLIKKIKDLAAAEVLISALTSIVIAAVIFIPKFMV